MPRNRINVNRNEKRVRNSIRTNSQNIRMTNPDNTITEFRIYRFRRPEIADGRDVAPFTNADIRNLTLDLYDEFKTSSNAENARMQFNLDVYTDNIRFHQNNLIFRNFGERNAIVSDIAPEKKYFSETDDTDLDDWNINTFYIQTYKTYRPFGNGKDGKGFCFWDCIKDYINPIYLGNYKKLIANLNEFIKNDNLEYQPLSEEGTVYIDQIPFIEKKIGISFTVYENGKEVIYQTKFPQMRHINLNLKDNHFTIKKEEKTYKSEYLKNVFKERIISPKYVIAYAFENEYDKQTKKPKFDEDILVLYRYNIEHPGYCRIPNPRWSEYMEKNAIKVKMTQVRGCINEAMSEKSNYECFIKYINCIRQIREISFRYNTLQQGKDYSYFDLFKFKKIAHFLRHHIHNYIKKINLDLKLEEITENEFNRISKTSGQLVKTDCKFETDWSKWFHYDQKSSYPYMLMRNDMQCKNDLEKNQHSKFLFDPNDFKSIFNSTKKNPLNVDDNILYIPLKQGEVYEMKNMEKFLKNNIKNMDLRYGIYHVEVIFKDYENNKYNGLFRFNPDNYYTHFDLMVAYAIDKEVEFKLVDNKILWWRKENRIESFKIFSNYIQQMYLIRLWLDDNPLVKCLLSQIHGSLCQKNRKTTKEEELDEEELKEIDEDTFELNPNEINGIFEKFWVNTNTEELQIKTVKKGFYYSPLARLRPFLFSYQRYFFFFYVFKPLIDNGYQVKKIFTDGFYVDKRIPKFDELEKQSTQKHIGMIYYDPK